MKKHVSALVSAIRPYIKEFFMLLCSFLLIAGGLALSFVSGNDYDEWENVSMITSIFGEGFDTFCSLDVKVFFTDTGEVIFQFDPWDSSSVPQTAWVAIASFSDYTWTISGNIKHREPSCGRGDDPQEVSQDNAYEMTGYFKKLFRVTVDVDEVPEIIYIQLDSKAVIYQYGDVTRIRAPYVGTRYYNYDIVESNDFNLKEFIRETGADFVERFFSLGKIDGKLLSPAMLRITGTYESKKFYFDPSYKIENISPTSYRTELQGIEWEQEGFLFTPIIEYTSKTKGIIRSFIAFLMTSVGSFMLPIPIEQFYVHAMESRKKNKPKRRKKKNY